MARPEGETSNSLFQELADWNDQLKHENPDLDTTKTSKAKPPENRGPSL